MHVKLDLVAIFQHVSSRGRFVEIRGLKEIDIYTGFSTWLRWNEFKYD